MGFSKYASVIMYSLHCNKPRNHIIDSVAIHTMAANISVESCGTWFQNPEAQASSNYGIDSSGKIAGYVDEDNRAWCTDSCGVDHRAITIEVASMTDDEPYQPTNEAYAALIKLLVDICYRHNIYELKWKNDIHYALAAADGGPVREQNMFVHRWFNMDKSCPGNWLFMHMDQIANEVNEQLTLAKKGRMTAATVTNSVTYLYGSASYTSTGTPESAPVDYTEYNPYLVTLVRNSKIDYSKLHDAGVIGGVIEAGYVFEDNRRRTKEFLNPNFTQQADALEEINMPYGLFMYGRAITQKEADEEIFQFSFPIRSRVPQLGVWIYLDLGRNKEINNGIMDRYWKGLVRLGYKDQMGIMATGLQLSYIDWDSYKDKFFLWTLNHVSDLSELDTLLDPTFFDTDAQREFYDSNSSILQQL